MENSNLNFKYWLRWIAVIPCSIVAFILSTLLSGIILPQWDILNYPSQLISSIAGPVCFVLVGASIAPIGKFTTAILLVIINALFSGVIILTFAVVINPTPEIPLWWLIVCNISGVGASILCCIPFRSLGDITLGERVYPDESGELDLSQQPEPEVAVDQAQAEHASRVDQIRQLLDQKSRSER